MRVLILGASRGLGAALVKVIHKVSPASQLMLVSRKLELLNRLARKQDEVAPSDLSCEDQWNDLFAKILEFQPEKIFYVAGGGPYGVFRDKQWKDHKWAFKVNFEFPAWLLHRCLRCKDGALKQIVFVGSSVADCRPDPKAASYAAGKHALKGLVDSVVQESSDLDLRLFRPGYMDTEMLPPNAWPRQQQGVEVQDPDDVALCLWQWAEAEVR